MSAAAQEWARQHPDEALNIGWPPSPATLSRTELDTLPWGNIRHDCGKETCPDCGSVHVPLPKPYRHRTACPVCRPHLFFVPATKPGSNFQKEPK